MSIPLYENSKSFSSFSPFLFKNPQFSRINLALLYQKYVFIKSPTFVHSVLTYSDTPQDQRIDPMVYVFPRVTKCIFHKYGASGSIQKHDVSPLSTFVARESIFIFRPSSRFASCRSTLWTRKLTFSSGSGIWFCSPCCSGFSSIVC